MEVTEAYIAAHMRGQKELTLFWRAVLLERMSEIGNALTDNSRAARADGDEPNRGRGAI